MKEIQQANYWEHFKHAKELAMYLPPSDAQRIRIENVLSEMLYSTPTPEPSVATDDASSNEDSNIK